MRTQRFYPSFPEDSGETGKTPEKRTKTLRGMPQINIGPNGTPTLNDTTPTPVQPEAVQAKARKSVFGALKVEERESPFAQIQRAIRELEEGDPDDRSYDKYFRLVDKIKFLRSQKQLSDETAYGLIRSLEKIVPNISAEATKRESAGLMARLRQEIGGIQEGQGYKRYYEVLNDILVARGRKSLSDNTTHELIQLLNSKDYAER